MADVKIQIPNLGKEVLVAVPDSIDLQEAFNEASSFVRSLEVNKKIRDLTAGVNPERATHEIIADNGGWRLQRFRMF